MRLIDADSIEKEVCGGCVHREHKYENCIDCALANAPTVEPASPWHRVEEELPRGQELVIVAVKDTAGDTPFWYTSCGWITTDGEYWIVDNEICDYVVAWMPLPEPPKEDA